MISNDQQKMSRQITYRAGWKKGAMTLDEQGRIIKRKPQSNHKELSWLAHIAEACAWRRMPYFPWSMEGIIVWALPVISFTMTVLLVYALRSL